MSEGEGMPRGWLTARLGEIVLPRLTCNPAKERKGAFRYIDIDALDNRRQVIVAAKTIPTTEAPSRARMLVHAGDVLFSLVRPYLKNVAVVPDDLSREVASTAYCVLRPAKGVDGHFLFHQVCQESFIHSVPTYGNSPPAARDDEFLDMVVTLAPTSEQRRIVAKIEELFSDLDAGVAALERARANLERYRAAVLKAAVEGRLTEQWRKEHRPREPAGKLLERILAERRRKWEQDQLAKFAAAGKTPPKGWKDKYPEPTPPDTSGLPDLPEGWCWASVEQLLCEDSCNGISVKGSDEPPGVPALRLSAMSDRGFDYEDRRFIPISDRVAEDLAIHADDFFVARGNGSLHLVGRGTLAQDPGERIVFPDTMIRLRLADLGVLRRFVATIWAARFVRRQIERKAKTSAGIYKISQRDVAAFVVPLPPLKEQDHVVNALEEGLSAAEHTYSQIEGLLRRAARLRQSILKRAFEGKLVPQDPTDEPAGKLLERIRAERERGSSPRSTTNGPSRRGRPPSKRKADSIEGGLFDAR